MAICKSTVTLIADFLSNHNGTSSCLRTLQPPPADPILGLADLFRADDRPGKINLGIGVYKDETGKTPVLTSVKKKAEQYLLEK